MKGSGLLGQDELDVVARHAFQHGFQAAQHFVDVDRCESAGLLVAVDGELSEEAGGTRHFTKDHLALMSLGRVAADRRQPLLPVLTDVAEEVVARDRDF